MYNPDILIQTNLINYKSKFECLSFGSIILKLPQTPLSHQNSSLLLQRSTGVQMPPSMEFMEQTLGSGWEEFQSQLSRS